MMRYCSYPNCDHGLSLKSECKLHRLPSDKDKCRIWMRDCRLAGTPRKLPVNVHICSCHFDGGRGPSKLNPHPIPFQSPANAKGHFVSKTFRPNVPDVAPSVVENPMQENVTVAAAPTTGTTQESSPSMQENVTVAAAPTTGTTQESSPYSTPCTPINTLKNVFPNEFLETIRAAAQSFTGSDISDGSVGGCDSSASEMAQPLGCFEYNKRHAARCSFNLNKKRVGGKRLSLEKKEPHKAEFGVQCDLPFLSYEMCVVKWSDDDFQHFTGISKEAFDALYEFLGGDKLCSLLKYKLDAKTPSTNEHRSLHSTRGKLFMTLVRLRRGYPLKDMSVFFKLGETAIGGIFLAWVKLMSVKFRSLEDAMFVSVAVQQKNQPDCFKPFPSLRCIIDTTEIKIQKPSNMEQQSNTYSVYKGCNTAKFLVVSSVYGGLSFISDGAESSISDRKLFLKSGILDHLNPGEAVMADRGFDIEADLNKFDVDLIIPPFLGDREAFTERETFLHKAISTTRIHVETLIGRIKEYRFLRYVVPASMLDILSDIVRVCAVLVNFRNPVVRWHHEDLPIPV